MVGVVIVIVVVVVESFPEPPAGSKTGAPLFARLWVLVAVLFMVVVVVVISTAV